MKLDAIIVGARCAGAATAMLLARAGARVLLVDKGEYGADTLSTHALMRGGVLQLHRWGLLPAIAAAGVPPVQRTTFSYASQDITVPIEPKYGVGALFAPRRRLLDRTLVDAAAMSGADVTYGVRVEDVIRDQRGRVRGIHAAIGGRTRELTADIVVGADGMHSRIAQAVGAPSIAEGRHATGTLYSYWQGLSADGYYWRFVRGGGAGLIPTNDGATCVFVGLQAERFREEVGGDASSAYRRLLRETAPAIDAALETATRVESVRGFAGRTGYIKQSTGPGWALVGDAGYFKDPLTAHGITDALRDAELLARAILKGTTGAFLDYETTRLDLSQRLFQLTDEIASLDWTDEQVQSLHRAFSTEMSREVRAIAALEPLPCPLPLASARRAV